MARGPLPRGLPGERARYIPNFEETYQIPIRTRSTFRALFDGLVRLLGADVVQRTSEAEIDTQFESDNDAPRVGLIEYFEREITLGIRGGGGD